MSREDFAREGRLILGRSGGLNSRSRALLAAAAQRHGIPVDELAQTLAAPRPIRRIEAPAPAPAAVPASPAGPAVSLPTPAPLPRPAPAQPSVPQSRLRPIAPRADRPAFPEDAAPGEVDPATHTLRVALTFGSIVLVGLVLGLTSVWMIVSGLSTPPGRTKPPIATSAPTRAASPTPPKPDRELFPTSPGPKRATEGPTGPSELSPPDADGVTLVRALGASTDLVATDPVRALAQFTDAVQRLGGVWPGLAPDQLARAQDFAVEFMYRSGKNPDLAARAAMVVAAGAEAIKPGSGPQADRSIKRLILPSVWSRGLLARLSSERDIAAEARARIESAAGDADTRSAGTFISGASSAVAEWPLILSHASPNQPSPQPAIDLWREWLRAADAVAGADQAARSRFSLTALETLLTEGPEPVDGPVVIALIRAARWHAEDDTRARFLRWFENPAVSGSDLHAVTKAMVEESGAEGLNVTMVLQTPTDDPQRLAMRDTYALAWGMRDGPARDALVVAWADAAKNFIVPLEPNASPVSSLARAVVLSRLNEAAGLLWAGQQQGVGQAIQDADKVVNALVADAAASGAAQSLDDTSSDGAWAIDYLRAEKKVEERGLLLSKLGSTSAIGQVDAEVLASEAFRGSPTNIRKSAQELSLKFSSSPAMVNAALEQATTMPRTTENAELVRRMSLGTLPALRDPSWRAAARRALVERLLEMVAARGDQGLVDRLADVLSESYRARVIVAPSDTKSEHDSASSEKVMPEIAAHAVRASWFKWAQALTPSGQLPISLDQIQRHIGGRSQLASGMIQRFIAEQADTAELMGFVVAVEQSHSTREVARVLEAFERSRRKADHAFEQILAAERAMSEFWALRLGVPMS